MGRALENPLVTPPVMPTEIPREIPREGVTRSETHHNSEIPPVVQPWRGQRVLLGYSSPAPHPAFHSDPVMLPGMRP